MTAATVITPFSWAGQATELANRQWRKRILPIGDVEYQGRVLHFTRDYLGKLADAFRSRAYDQVPFQLADSGNRHTNDPERFRGTITDLELADDGLYAVLDPTEAGEAVLRDNPHLGVSARIVEGYARSDGKFYPAAIQHILGTLDPRIPALGSWQPVEMSNGPQFVIDLSASTWEDEPGPDFSLIWNAVAARLPSRGQALDEYDDLEAVLAAELPGGGYGYELANDPNAQRFIELTGLEFAREQQRQAEDAEEARRKPGRIGQENEYDRMNRLVSRAVRGTLTPQGWHAREFASPAPDGYCMNTHHEIGCGSAVGPDVT
jgi:hypothetical protein